MGVVGDAAPAGPVVSSRGVTLGAGDSLDDVTPEVLVEISRRVQALPYRWPGPPDAASTAAIGAGTCAGKHALLAQRLQSVGLDARPLLVVGPLAPSLWPDLAATAAGLLEVHECLTVLTPWTGPLTVDVTWHPAAVTAGLPGLLDLWDGWSDSPVAVEPAGAGYAVPQSHLRQAKEALRAHRPQAADVPPDGQS